MAQNNYLAKVEFNRRANDATGIHVLNNVAKAFGMFWWFFGLLSIAATYFTLDLVFSSWEIDPVILAAIVFGISFIWDIFKYYSIEWIYADQVLSTAQTAKVVAVLLVGGSMAFHVYGATLRSSDSSTAKVTEEVNYQRALEKSRLDLQNKLLEANENLTPVLLNGTSKDDAETVKTMNLSLELLAKLQNEKGGGITSEELMTIYGKNIEAQSDGIMYAQIIAECFLLFSLLSKFIYKENRDEEMQDLSEMYETLQEMLHLSRSQMSQEFIAQTLEQIREQNRREEQGGKPIGRDYFKNKILDAKELLGVDRDNSERLRQIDEAPKRIGTIKPTFSRERKIVEEAVECEDEILDAETVEVKGTQYRCLDYRNYNDDEIYVIQVLWDNGDVLPGEFLVKTDQILENQKHRKRIKGLVHVLNVLRGKLADKGYIKNSSRGYIADSALPKQLWQEKEE